MWVSQKGRNEISKLEKQKKYPLGSNNIYVRFLWNVARSQSDSQTHKMQKFSSQAESWRP